MLPEYGYKISLLTPIYQRCELQLIYRAQNENQTNTLIALVWL